MRRILFPLLVIGLAAGLFTLGSGAFFSDAESDTGNTITAGSLDLAVTTAFSSTCTTANLVKPGDTQTCSNTVTNNGSIIGDLYLRIVYTPTDPSTNEPECVDEGGLWTGTCGGGGWVVVNDLGAVLTLSGSSVAASTGTVGFAGDTTLTGLATWKALGTFACTKVAVLANTQTFNESFPTTFSTAATNKYQTDTAQLTFHYELVQTSQSATCP